MVCVLQTKAQLKKEYEKDYEDYKKIKAIYEDSLTDKQKEDIKRVKEVRSAAKEKKLLKAVSCNYLDKSEMSCCMYEILNGKLIL